MPHPPPTQRLGDALIQYDNTRRNTMACLLLGLTWLLLTPLLKAAVPSWIYLGPPVFLVLLAGSGSLAAFKARQRFAAMAAACMGAEEIGPLMRVADSPDHYVREVARNVLIRLLCALRTDDGHSLVNREREWMLQRLRAAHTEAFPDVMFLDAILSAQEWIGTPSVVPLVEALANTAVHPDVRGVAAARLPAIRESAARNRDGKVLLRSVDERMGKDESLLRPAGSSQHEEPDRLLRPR